MIIVPKNVYLRSEIDVTLVTNDESKLFAHKVVLSATSTFILRTTATSNPIIYLSEVNSQNLNFNLDYLFKGEVQLDDFLNVAQKLKI